MIQESQTTLFAHHMYIHPWEYMQLNHWQQIFSCLLPNLFAKALCSSAIFKIYINSFTWQIYTFIQMWVWSISNKINICVDSCVTEYVEDPFCLNSKPFIPRSKRAQQHRCALIRSRGLTGQERKGNPEEEGEISTTLRGVYYFFHISWVMSICMLQMYEAEQWEMPHL